MSGQFGSAVSGGRGGGRPTRLCPGERTNGLVSLPRGSSAGPSSTWVINVCDRGDSRPRSGLKTQRQLRLVMALSGRRPVITCGLSSRADDTPSDTRVILFYFLGKSSLAVKPSSDVSVNNANGSAGRWCAPIADRPTACAPLPFFSPSPSEVISKPIPNAAFEKRDYCDVSPPPRANVFKFASPKEQQSNKLFKE